MKVVNDISFDVREGELLAFLGPNGAGKSTTVDCLSTLTKFDSGEIKLAGFDIKTQSQTIKQKIGIVFQEGLLDKKLTVADNLTLRAGFYYPTRQKLKKPWIVQSNTQRSRTYLSVSMGNCQADKGDEWISQEPF